MSSITIHREPQKCTLAFGPHQCNLIDCHKDDPDWIHMCYANDFDVTAREVVEFNKGKWTAGEFERMGEERAFERAKTMYREFEKANGLKPVDVSNYDPSQLRELWENRDRAVRGINGMPDTFTPSEPIFIDPGNLGQIVAADDPWDGIKSKYELTPIAVDQPKPTITFEMPKPMLPEQIRKQLGL